LFVLIFSLISKSVNDHKTDRIFLRCRSDFFSNTK